MVNTNRSTLEDGLLVVPPHPADLDVVAAAERAGRSGRDPTVREDQLKPVGDGLPVQILQHQLAGPVLVGGSGHHRCGHREAGDVDGDDALGAVRAAVGAAAVVEVRPPFEAP